MRPFSKSYHFVDCIQKFFWIILIEQPVLNLLLIASELFYLCSIDFFWNGTHWTQHEFLSSEFTDTSLQGEICYIESTSKK